MYLGIFFIENFTSQKIIVTIIRLTPDLIDNVTFVDVTMVMYGLVDHGTDEKL